MIPIEPYVPEDIDQFWQEVEAEAHAVPLDYHRSLTNDWDMPGFVVERIEFVSTGGRTVHGWFAYPEQGARRLPGFVWVPPYGRESLRPNAYGTREGFASLSLNLHGLGAFHEERYLPERGYFGEGAADPHTWVFRRMYQDASVAVRVLQAQVEVDEDRLGAMGMSQGGGMSIWLGAWNPHVRAVCADMPFLGGIRQALERPVHRYPLKELVEFAERTPLGQERLSHTISYFDTMNQATRCVVPTQVSLGLKDPAARPEQVQAIFAALKGRRELIEYDWGHDWHPDMVENNRRWLLEHL
jgi:cephalosporin-C deacetylase